MLRERGFYKGVNLGGWLSQCDYSEDRLDNFIKEEDIANISSWELDHVRIPIDYNVLENEDGTYTIFGLTFRTKADFEQWVIQGYEGYAEYDGVMMPEEEILKQIQKTK